MDQTAAKAWVYRFGSFALDPMSRKLTFRENAVRLTTRPFDLLLYGVENAGRVIEKDELITAVWTGRAVEEANLSQTVFVLRRTLRDAGGEDCIVTVPGRGYRFVAEVERVPRGTLHEAESGSLWTPDPQRTAADDPSATAAASVRLRSTVWRMGYRAAASAGAALIVVVTIIVWAGGSNSKLKARFDPPPRSVAILAFTNMSSDHADDGLADGVSEELTETLARGDNLLVTARTSAFSFRSSTATIGEIARKLNVRAVVEGTCAALWRKGPGLGAAH